MSPLLFLTGIGFAAAFGYAIRDTAKIQKKLSSVSLSKTKFLGMVEKLVLLAQLSEVAHAMQHATVIDALITLALFGLWLGLKSGTESVNY